MSNKKSFILHHDSLEIFDKLSDEEAGKVFKAMIAFNVKGEIVELEKMLEFVFIPFKSQFIRDMAKYEEVSEARTDAAKKRWEERNRKN